METKTIYEIFSKLSQDEIKKQFRDCFVDVPDAFRFAKVNIIIGSNGSGKTRFLKALRKLYKRQDGENVIYGYFPALSDKKVESDFDDDPPVTLFESISSGDVSFEDFFGEIERHNEEFVQELLSYRSKRRSEIQDLVVKSFHALTNKTLEFRNKGQAFIVEANGKSELLSNMLDKLSPGELMLFYMSIFLALRKDKASGKAIILDEPECHLHPKALRAFIKLLKKHYNLASIWIATHSLFLVPDFEFENIVYVENNKIQPRGSLMYQSILDGLLGDRKSVELFFSSLSQWQFCEFVVECFTNPTVFDVIDPQDEQVKLFIKNLADNKPMRILDWGGGSARLGESLLAAGFKHGEDFSYTIYDSDPKYLGKEFTVFKAIDDIHGTYHCIVMMNFLHEVEPKQWVDIFTRVAEFLDDDGFILFVEVKALRDGEMPNRTGFLLLGPEEMHQLFPGNRTFNVCIKRKSIGVLIPKNALSTISSDSVNCTLKHLEKRILCEIKELRTSQDFPKEFGEIKTMVTPRHYAFLLQQYINVMLYNNRENEKAFTKKLAEVQTKEKRLSSMCRDQAARIEIQTDQIKELTATIDELRAKNCKLDLELLLYKIKSSYMGDDRNIISYINCLTEAVKDFIHRGSIPGPLRETLIQEYPRLIPKVKDDNLYDQFCNALHLLGINV